MTSGVPDLSAAREAVSAAMSRVPGSLRAPALAAPGPLTTLPASIEATLAARAASGYDPIGADHPRSRTWQQVVLPTGVLAVVDAGGSGVLLATDHPWYALVGAIVFVPLAGGSAVARRYAAKDPLRLSAKQLRVITAAGRWESNRTWIGPLSECDERALVVVATACAARIAATAHWRTGDHRARLDLASELTQIDDQAYRIASARAGGPMSGGPVSGRPMSGGPMSGGPVSGGPVDDAWAALLDRVAALHAYAAALIAADDADAQRRAAFGDPRGEAALAAGSARDELAADHLRSLTQYLDRPPASGFTLE